jgi:hypothetical protein
MGLIFFEGFNRTFAAVDPAENSGGKWTWTTVNSLTPVFGYGGNVRNGSGGLYMQSNFGAGNNEQPYTELTVESQANKTLYLGFAVYTLYTGDTVADALSPYHATLLRFYSETNEQFRLDLDCSPGDTDKIGFTFKNASGTILSSPLILTNAVPVSNNARSYGYLTNYSTWAYVELKITINSSGAGSAEVRVDGLALQNSTGGVTVQLPTIANINKIRFCGNETSETIIDDFYLLDNSGVSLNTWLGPTVKIFSPTLVTTNADVTTTTTQEWDTVGSLTLDSHNPDGDYLTTKTVNKTQFYVLSSSDDLFSIPETETVAAVQVRSIARETSLPAAYKQVFKPTTPGSVVDLSAELDTAAYYQSATTILTANPATSSAWTTTALSTAHFGVKSVTRT